MYISEMPLSQTIKQINDGNLDPEDLVNQICDRIDAFDRIIQSFLPEPGRRQRMLHDAALLKLKYKGKTKKPALYGIPIGVKDLFNVDGFPTRAGSYLPYECFSGAEAEVVTRLKKAGAIIVGKTVTTEFAYFEPGPTRNPHNTDHTPGGSSSGSAAAVACGFTPLALGTQTIGSIGRPASYCGVFGFKPSYGQIPVSGIFPFSSSADQVGFFTQDFEGIALTAPILCQKSKKTSITDELPVVGIATGTYLDQADSEMINLVAEIKTRLLNFGCKVIEADLFGPVEVINELHRAMVACDFYQVHRDLYDHYASLYRPQSKALVEKGKTIDGVTYSKARMHCHELSRKIKEFSKKPGIDIWISPSATGAAPKGIHATGSPVMNLPWTHAGVPVLTVPVSKNHQSLPLGLQLAGKYNADCELLQQCRKIMPVLFTS